MPAVAAARRADLRARARTCAASSAPIAAGVREVAVFPAASETFSQRNLNHSSTRRCTPPARCVPRRSPRACGCAATCPRHSAAPTKGPSRSAQVHAASARRCWRTASSNWRSATRSAWRIPGRSARCPARDAGVPPVDRIALHFHDTRGTALANVLAALDARHHDVRCLCRRPRRLPVRARGTRQPRDRGPALHAARPRPGARHRPRRHRRRLVGIEPAVGQPLPSRYYRAARATRARARRYGLPATGSRNGGRQRSSAHCAGRPAWRSTRVARRAASRSRWSWT